MAELRRLAGSNPRVKALRRLSAQRSARAAAGLAVAEGAKLVREALAAGRVERIFVRDETVAGVASASVVAIVDLATAAGVDVFALEPPLFDAIAPSVEPQPVLAEVRLRLAPLTEAASLAIVSGPIIVLVGVADPGNAGTIVRVAEAVGAPCVVACDSSADLTNPKAYRAAAGSLLRVPVVTHSNPMEVVAALRSRGAECLGLTSDSGENPFERAWRYPCALFVGSESHGLAPALVSVLDGTVAIPMAGQVESLNAGIAAAVVAFAAAHHGAARSGLARRCR